MHSFLMVNPLKHLDKLPKIKADVVTLNLEDAIAPLKKQEALKNIINFFKSSIKIEPKIIVRVNPLNEGGADEIKALNSFNFLGFRVPKVKTKQEIIDALKLINEDKELHISLETKEAFYNVRDWRVNNRFTTANLGILDLLNSLNMPQSLVKLNNPTIEYILSKFLLDCQSVGLRAVSFMYQDYNNLDEFKKWCEKEKLMGFSAKACMGPKQVEIVNDIFKIDTYQINRAKEIVEFFKKHSKNSEHGIMHPKYGFIDEPIYKDALLVLKNAI